MRQLCRQAEEYLVQNVIIHIVQMPEPKLILIEITEFAGLRAVSVPREAGDPGAQCLRCPEAPSCLQAPGGPMEPGVGLGGPCGSLPTWDALIT